MTRAWDAPIGRVALHGVASCACGDCDEMRPAQIAPGGGAGWQNGACLCNEAYTHACAKTLSAEAAETARQCRKK